MEIVQFGHAQMQGLQAFMDEMGPALQRNGITMQQFQMRKVMSANDLNYLERDIMKDIRNSVPNPDENTLLQKAIPVDDVNAYIDNSWNTVQGYIARAQDTKYLSTYKDYYDTLRLNFNNSPFNPQTDKAMGVIRFNTLNTNSIEIPYNKAMGGNNTDAWPCTGHAFTAAENEQVIPEFYIDKSKAVAIQDGAELYKIYQDGTEILWAVFKGNKFQPTFK